MKIAAPGPSHHSVQAWFVHGKLAQITVVPGIDTGLVDINNRYLHSRAAIGDDRHGWSAHVAGTNAADGADGGSTH